VTDVVLSIERTRRGFALHLVDGARRLDVAKRERRAVEGAFRSLGVTVVDEYGCRIDQSQFDREADPTFNHKLGPSAWQFWPRALVPNEADGSGFPLNDAAGADGRGWDRTSDPSRVKRVLSR
jgi:hypothetical protein